MLTPQEAFKVGFLARCVEDGLNPAQMLAAVKQASDMLEKRAFVGTLLGKGVDVVRGVGKGIAGYGVPLALVAPPVIGGLAGYGLARATDIDDTDVDEVKDREVIEEYRRQTEGLARHKAMKEHRRPTRPLGRPLL